jgi:hypothetical protein
MQHEYYQTYEIGTRIFFIDKYHGFYDVGYMTRYGRKFMLGKKQDTPADCHKIILNFLDESTKKQFTYGVVRKLFFRAPRIIAAKL